MRAKVREVRERLFVTQAELAERTGIAEATLSRIENGLQRPRISTVRKIAEALGVRPEELVEWGGEEAAGTGKAAAWASRRAASPWQPSTRRSQRRVRTQRS